MHKLFIHTPLIVSDADIQLRKQILNEFDYVRTSKRDSMSNTGLNDVASVFQEEQH